MQEFYIRNESDTEARGPFTLEQLSSLLDSGQLSPATLFYDANTEQWTSVESISELKTALFPEKKKLTIRTKQKLEILNKNVEGVVAITVNDMLAAAEGRTAETRSKRDPAAALARGAAMGRYAAILALVCAAAGEVLPTTEVVLAMDPLKILANPLIILGALDLFLAVVLGLGVTTLYPFVRFRAALGFGFLGFIFWTHGQVLPLLVLGAGCTGLFLSTLFVSYLPVVLAAVLGIGGFAFVAWQLLS